MNEDTLTLKPYRLKRADQQAPGVVSAALMPIVDDGGTASFVFPPGNGSLDLREDAFALYQGVALDLPLPRGLRRVTSLLPDKMAYWDDEPELVTATDGGDGALTVKLITLLEKSASRTRPASDQHKLATEASVIKASKVITNSMVINAFVCTGTGYPCIVLCMTVGGSKDYPCLEWDHQKHYPGVMAEFAAKTGNETITDAPIYLLPGFVREESDPFGLIYKAVYVALVTEEQRIRADAAIMNNDNDFQISAWNELGEIEGVGIMIDPQFGLRPCVH